MKSSRKARRRASRFHRSKPGSKMNNRIRQGYSTFDKSTTPALSHYEEESVIDRAIRKHFILSRK